MGGIWHATTSQAGLSSLDQFLVPLCRCTDLSGASYTILDLLLPGELDDTEVAVSCDRPGALLEHDELHPALGRENWP